MKKPSALKANANVIGCPRNQTTSIVRAVAVKDLGHDAFGSRKKKGATLDVTAKVSSSEQASMAGVD